MTCKRAHILAGKLLAAASISPLAGDQFGQSGGAAKVETFEAASNKRLRRLAGSPRFAFAERIYI